MEDQLCEWCDNVGEVKVNISSPDEPQFLILLCKDCEEYDRTTDYKYEVQQ